jgi:inosine triphosphate pyrophosphatase
MPIYFVTSNSDKRAEFERIFNNHSIKNVKIEHTRLDSVEIQDTVEEISLNKCEQFVKSLSHNMDTTTGGILCEDVSLEFNVLKGMPGPYIKWFNESLGPQGLFDMIKDRDDHTAVATCCYTYYDFETNRSRQFLGQSDGIIVSPRGNNKLGWDEIFEPLGQPTNNKLTFAEMSRFVKDSYSHRAMAILQFIDYLNLKK